MTQQAKYTFAYMLIYIGFVTISNRLAVSSRHDSFEQDAKNIKQHTWKCENCQLDLKLVYGYCDWCWPPSEVRFPPNRWPVQWPTMLAYVMTQFNQYENQGIFRPRSQLLCSPILCHGQFVMFN